MEARGLLSASHEAICRHIWLDKAKGGSLHQFLQQSSRKRRKRYGQGDFRGRIPCRTDISERPTVVEERSRLEGLGGQHGHRQGASRGAGNDGGAQHPVHVAHLIRSRTKGKTSDALLLMLSLLSE